MTLDGNVAGSAHHAQGNGEGLCDVDDAGEGTKARFQVAIKNASLIFLRTDLPDIERKIENAAGRVAR